MALRTILTQKSLEKCRKIQSLLPRRLSSSISSSPSDDNVVLEPPNLPDFDYIARKYNGPSADQVFQKRKKYLGPSVFHFYQKPVCMLFYPFI